MTDMASADRPDATLGAELALGLLDGLEREVAERRLAAEPGMRAEHDWWRERLADLAGGPGEPPAPSLWTRITARLPANDTGDVERGLGRGIGTARSWRGGAIAATALAAVLGAGLVISLGRPPRTVTVFDRVIVPPPLVAVLSGTDDPATTLAISYDPRVASLRAVPARLEAGGGSLELWVIPADGKPRALGLLPTDAAILPALSTAATPYLRAEATLAVSREPKGGSTTGAPTGPVILKGRIVSL